MTLKKRISKENSDTKTSNSGYKLNKIPEIYIQLALVLFTGVLAIVSICQYNAGINSIKTTNRAYLRASPNFKKHYTSDSMGEFEIIINPHNYGRTPPHNVETVAYIILADSSYAHTHINGDTLVQKNRIGYGNIKLKYTEKPFPRDWLIEKAVLTFYLSGKINYRDIFNRFHTTKFCFRYNWQDKYFEECGKCNHAN